MKKTLAVVIGAALSVISASSLAADATITVKGELIPTGCTLAATDGNILDFGTRAVDKLTADASNYIGTKQSHITIECPSDMYVAFSTMHLNQGSESLVRKLSNGSSFVITRPDNQTQDIDLGGNFPASQINPLMRAGAPATKPAGAFWTLFSSPKVTTTANSTAVEKNMIYVNDFSFGATWNPATSISLQDGIRMISVADGSTATTPMAVKTVVFQADTAVTLLDKASFNDLTDREQYNGGFEITLRYK